MNTTKKLILSNCEPANVMSIGVGAEGPQHQHPVIITPSLGDAN